MGPLRLRRRRPDYVFCGCHILTSGCLFAFESLLRVLIGYTSTAAAQPAGGSLSVHRVVCIKSPSADHQCPGTSIADTGQKCSPSIGLLAQSVGGVPVGRCWFDRARSSSSKKSRATFLINTRHPMAHSPLDLGSEVSTSRFCDDTTGETIGHTCPSVFAFVGGYQTCWRLQLSLVS